MAMNQRRHRILVVDDDIDIAETLQELLAYEGYAVRTANNGVSALDVVADFRPDIVFCDLTMPIMGGLEFAKEVRARPGGTGVFLIAITGLSRRDDEERSLAAGFDSILTKPVSVETILMTLINGGTPGSAA